MLRSLNFIANKNFQGVPVGKFYPEKSGLATGSVPGTADIIGEYKTKEIDNFSSLDAEDLALIDEDDDP